MTKIPLDQDVGVPVVGAGSAAEIVLELSTVIDLN